MNIYKGSCKNFIEKHMHISYDSVKQHLTLYYECAASELYKYTCLRSDPSMSTRLYRETNKMLLSKQILFTINNHNGPDQFLYQKDKFIYSRAPYPCERNSPAYDRLHVIEIHDQGISGSDRRTDISTNTRLLAPIVPLYTTEIPSKMQEDTGRAGRNS